MQSILIIEDEIAIADTIIYALRTEGFQTDHYVLGRDGLAALTQGSYDLLILDVGLPDYNGFDLCREMRKFSDIPVIFLTARATEIDRIVGLEIGADDYVTKPFSPRELVARVRVILRRLTPRPEKISHEHSHPFRLDVAQNRIWFGDSPLELTRYEFLLLKTLLQHPGRIFTREDLMQLIWTAPEHSTERTVDSHIKTLRSKLREVSPDYDPIETHRGLGYGLRNR
jgi:two-component system catabolic regulation response regulator CreB